MAHLVKLIVSRVKLFSPIGQSLLLSIDRLEFEAGLIYGLVGKNLSGRSSLLRLLGGGFLPQSDKSQSGRKELLWSHSGEITELDPSRHSVYLGPNPSDSLSTLASTIQDEIALHCHAGKTNPLITDGKCRLNLADCLRLDQCLHQNPMELSGGQTAALTLACAIELDRPVLCIDETLSHLDVDLSPKAWGFLKEFASQGRIVLIADNKYDFMAEYVDRVILLKQMQVEGLVLPKAAFNIPDVREQDTVPAVTRLAGQIYKDKRSLPIQYKELRQMLFRTLNIGKFQNE